MAETVRDRINGYLEDAIAAERNFEDALHTFGKAGVQEPVRSLLARAGDKARTQHERLTRLLEQRGGSPSQAKSTLAHALAFAPLAAQTGHQPEEKNTQHLIITYAAAGAEQAMYESLAVASEEASEPEIVRLARELQSEEKQDAEQVWPLLRSSARDAFRAAVAAGRTPAEVLREYLQDAIAAENSFESQLTGFSKEGDYAPAQTAFAQHARETHTQYERLTARLRELGAKPSVARSLLAHFFAFAPKVAQLGHDATERTTQNLMMAFSVENAEVAMYEVLAAVAVEAGDPATEQLALDIQKQERETADKVWKLIPPLARKAIQDRAMQRAS